MDVIQSIEDLNSKGREGRNVLSLNWDIHFLLPLTLTCLILCLQTLTDTYTTVPATLHCWVLKLRLGLKHHHFSSFHASDLDGKTPPTFLVLLLADNRCGT